MEESEELRDEGKIRVTENSGAPHASLSRSEERSRSEKAEAKHCTGEDQSCSLPTNLEDGRETTNVEDRDSWDVTAWHSLPRTLSCSLPNINLHRGGDIKGTRGGPISETSLRIPADEFCEQTCPSPEPGGNEKHVTSAGEPPRPSASYHGASGPVPWPKSSHHREAVTPTSKVDAGVEVPRSSYFCGGIPFGESQGPLVRFQGPASTAAVTVKHRIKERRTSRIPSPCGTSSHDNSRTPLPDDQVQKLSCTQTSHSDDGANIPKKTSFGGDCHQQWLAPLTSETTGQLPNSSPDNHPRTFQALDRPADCRPKVFLSPVDVSFNANLPLPGKSKLSITPSKSRPAVRLQTSSEKINISLFSADVGNTASKESRSRGLETEEERHATVGSMKDSSQSAPNTSGWYPPGVETSALLRNLRQESISPLQLGNPRKSRVSFPKEKGKDPKRAPSRRTSEKDSSTEVLAVCEHQVKKQVSAQSLDDMAGQCVPLVGKKKVRSGQRLSDEVIGRPSLGMVCLGLTEKSGDKTLSRRLREKRRLNDLSVLVANLEWTLAVVGIILMMVDNELYFLRLVDYNHTISVIMRSLNSVTTVLLLTAVVWYNVVEVKVRMVDNGVGDWRLAITPHFFMRILVDWLCCVIHPPPLALDKLTKGPDITKWKDYHLNTTENYNDNTLPDVTPSIDSFLSILMLCRLTIFVRFAVHNSKLLSNTSWQSIGALNKVKMDWLFVFKAYMSDMPGTLLIMTMLMVYFINVWALHTCEAFFSRNNFGACFTEVFWLVAITFLTVGYGDNVPRSYCGRFISVTSGLLGVGTTALLVAVLAAKLEQSRSEKYVHNFLTRVLNDKRRSDAAANVIKSILQLWRLRCKPEISSTRRFHLQRLLIKSMQEMRETKNINKNVADSSIGILEVSKSINDVQKTVDTMQEAQQYVLDEVSRLSQLMTTIENRLDTLGTQLVQLGAKSVETKQDK